MEKNMIIWKKKLMETWNLLVHHSSSLHMVAVVTNGFHTPVSLERQAELVATYPMDSELTMV